jgi:hypothetical protein
MGNPIALPEIFKQGFQDFVTPEWVDAPFTQIQNRAQVSNSLKAIAGIERVPFHGLSILSNEFGPSGEVVYETDIKDPRVRFVGPWAPRSNNYGFYALSSLIGDFVEITFYGTGLDLLMSYLNNFAALDVRVTIDGGVESGDIITASYSNILGSRNYAPNLIVPVAANLSLGWHTVKIRNNSAQEFDVQGMQVRNSRSNIAILPGKAIAQGSSQGLAVLSTSSFNQDVAGTRGARVVKYIENGQIGSAVQEVDATSKYLSLTDHTNEEVVRRINFREFGANRADDFTTLAGVNSSRTFTLDDGTTTLSGLTANAQTINGIDAVFPGAGSDWISITFVGTGLDVFSSSSGYSSNGTITVDGVNQGAIVLPYGSVGTGLLRLCSGLPYGTHIVRINRTNASAFVGFSDFIIYQPKKPSIPDGAFEVVDYNVLADYITAATSVPVLLSSTGILRKLNTRELLYAGTWAFGAVDPVNAESGFPAPSAVVGSSYEYTFFGTGFDLNIPGGTGAGITTSTMSINGVTNLTGAGYTTAITTAGTATFNGATGVITVPISAAIFTVKVANMPLGIYTVRVTKTTGAFNSHSGSFDIITPIHINESSLKVGSQSLRSNQNYDVIKPMNELGPDPRKAKAWIIYDTTNTRIIDSYNVSAVISPGTGSGYIMFEKPFKQDDYIAVGSANGGTSKIVTFTTKRANSILFQNTTDLGGLENNVVSCLFYGELIDE